MNTYKLVSGTIYRVMDAIQWVAQKSKVEWQGALAAREWAYDVGPVAFIYNALYRYDHAAAQVQICGKAVLTTNWWQSGVSLEIGRLHISTDCGEIEVRLREYRRVWYDKELWEKETWTGEDYAEAELSSDELPF